MGTTKGFQPLSEIGSCENKLRDTDLEYLLFSMNSNIEKISKDVKENVAGKYLSEKGATAIERKNESDRVEICVNVNS